MRAIVAWSWIARMAVGCSDDPAALPGCDDASKILLFGDGDGDGYGDPGFPGFYCTPVPAAVPDNTDCDDTDPQRNPTSDERCNGLDDDCDGAVDEGLPAEPRFVDGDGDGVGAGVPVITCAPLPGTVTQGGDCDDTDPSVAPGRPERCNGLDDDCEGGIDEGLDLLPYYPDADGDGFGAGQPVRSCAGAPLGFVDNGLDCDDTDATANRWDVDADGVDACSGDCDDLDPTVSPEAIEVCNLGIDDDCDGLADDRDPYTTGQPTWWVDLDGDGFGGPVEHTRCLPAANEVAGGGDCDDDVASTNPSMPEICNGVDDDCDGAVDDDDPELDDPSAVRFYTDADGDGLGAGPSFPACIAPPGTASVDGDCDDLDPTFGDGSAWVRDDDGDGVGVLATSQAGPAPCVAPGPGWVEARGLDDCAPDDPTVHPGAVETCGDGTDQDCDGVDPVCPSNVLIVIIDDIGPAKVGAYGQSDQVRTPVIDGLAEQGVLFRNAWAYPSCSPTRAALHTGRLGRRTGLLEVSDPEDTFTVDPAEAFIAGLLPSDWSTGFYGKYHLSPAGFPTDRGWGDYAGSYSTLEGVGGEHSSYYLWRKTHSDGQIVESTDYATTDTVDDTIAALGVLTEPWLLHVSFNAVHRPLEPPPAHLHTYEGITASSPPIEIEHAMLEALDTELGRLLDAIPPEVRARTTVFVMGDNGEPEEMREVVEGPGGKLTLYDAGIRVPFIVQGYAVGAPGTESDSLVHVVDVVPTVLALAGVAPDTIPGVRDPSTPRVFDGIDLLPVLSDPTLPVHPTLYAERVHPNGFGPFDVDKVALRDERYKLMVDRISGLGTFHEYVPGRWEQGEDLLAAGPLTPERRAAYDRLVQQVEALVAAMEADAPAP